MSPAVTATLVEVLDSAFLRALAEPSRLELLKVLLERGPSDVGEIQARHVVCVNGASLGQGTRHAA